VSQKPTTGSTAVYLEVPAALRGRLDAFLVRTRRTLKGEVCNAIEQYLDREEALLTHRARAAESPPEKPRRKGKK
jgi:hypothetical protein